MGGAKRKLYENWKFILGRFSGCFDAVLEGFDAEKRGSGGSLNLGECATTCN